LVSELVVPLLLVSATGYSLTYLATGLFLAQFPYPSLILHYINENMQKPRQLQIASTKNTIRVMFSLDSFDSFFSDFRVSFGGEVTFFGFFFFYSTGQFSQTFPSLILSDFSLTLMHFSEKGPSTE